MGHAPLVLAASDPSHETPLFTNTVQSLPISLRTCEQSIPTLISNFTFAIPTELSVPLACTTITSAPHGSWSQSERTPAKGKWSSCHRLNIILPQWIENHLVAPVPLPPLQPPYSRWYDPRCDYHAGVVGHSTENLTALKKEQKESLRAWLRKVDRRTRCEFPRLMPVACRRKLVWGQWNYLKFEAEVIQQEFLDPDLRWIWSRFCEFHGGLVGHSIEKCARFRRKVQQGRAPDRIL